MADDVLIAAQRTGVPVATDALATLNGVTQDTTAPPQAQRIKLLHGPDGDGTDVSNSSGLPIRDLTGPLAGLAAGGLVVQPNIATQVFAAAGRLKCSVSHLGRISASNLSAAAALGELWVRYDGGDAAPGVGEVVYPKGYWWEITDSRVSVYYLAVAGEVCAISTAQAGSAA